MEQHAEVATDLTLINSQTYPCSTPSHFTTDEWQLTNLSSRITFIYIYIQNVDIFLNIPAVPTKVGSPKNKQRVTIYSITIVPEMCGQHSLDDPWNWNILMPPLECKHCAFHLQESSLTNCFPESLHNVTMLTPKTHQAIRSHFSPLQSNMIAQAPSTWNHHDNYYCYYNQREPLNLQRSYSTWKLRGNQVVSEGEGDSSSLN